MGDDDDEFVSEGDRLAAEYGLWIYIGGLQFGRTGGTRIHFSVANEEKTEEVYYVYTTSGQLVGDIYREMRYGHSNPRWLGVNPAATVHSFRGLARIAFERFSETSAHLTMWIGSYKPVTFKMLELNMHASNSQESGRVEPLLSGLKPIDLLRMW